MNLWVIEECLLVLVKKWYGRKPCINRSEEKEQRCL